MSQGRKIHTNLPGSSKNLDNTLLKRKIFPVVIIFIQFFPKYSKDNLKKIFKIKFAYVTNDTAETSIKNLIYHYTMPREMIICDSDGLTGNHIALTFF
jgi:hypothetical protein